MNRPSLGVCLIGNETQTFTSDKMAVSIAGECGTENIYKRQGFLLKNDYEV